MTKGKELIFCRHVLWILVFWGFGVNYMLRNNLNLAIVAIVMPRESFAAATECTYDEMLKKASTRYGDQLSTVDNLSTTKGNGTSLEERYDWNEYQQGLVLAAYYWLHWVTQLPGGLLARKYGTKIVFGLGNVLVAFLGFFIPLATHYSLNALIFIRATQGLISGVVWPSMHDMTAKWIPPNERSRFVSSYLGSSVGVAITYPLCAMIIEAYGWEAVFYVTSLIGITWHVFWIFLVYDSPRQHPRISDEERNYIVNSLSESQAIKEKTKNVPWMAIITSGPVWVTVLAHWGGIWGFITFMTQAPSYFNYVQGWNINAAGLLSGSPHIARMVFSYLFSMLSDWLLRTKRMSITNVRKLANFVCAGGQAILAIGLSLSGCAPILATFFMIAGTAINGAVSSGTIPTFVDLSPNYASVLFGICNLVTVPAGFLSPLVVGILTNDNQTIGQWRLVFLISAANLGVSCIVHLIWGSAIQQPWNNNTKEKNWKEVDSNYEGEELTTFVTEKARGNEKTTGKENILENSK